MRGTSFPSSVSSTVAMRMQEHRSRDVKKAEATPLKSHMATPSTLPQPGDPAWLRTLGTSSEPDRQLKKLVQLVEVAAAIFEEEFGEVDGYFQASFGIQHQRIQWA